MKIVIEGEEKKKWKKFESQNDLKRREKITVGSREIDCEHWKRFLRERFWNEVKKSVMEKPVGEQS